MTVPYIVRIETGYQDRDQYQIAMLYRPGQPWKPWAPQSQFNHKLLITHGAGCAVDHSTGPAPAVLDDTALARGFAVMSTALNNAGHNCNVVTQAESLVMAKEHLVERYGELRYTIGTGLLGRLADAAAGRQRLPRHLPGDPAAVQLPGRVVDHPAVRGPTTWSAPTSRTRPLGAGRGLDPLADRGGRGPSQPRQRDRAEHHLRARC